MVDFCRYVLLVLSSIAGETGDATVAAKMRKNITSCVHYCCFCSVVSARALFFDRLLGIYLLTIFILSIFMLIAVFLHFLGFIQL